MHSEPPKRQRLHSPILGGSGADDYDEPAPQAFARGNKGSSSSPMSQSQAGTGQKRGLRSPLLGGDDEDMDEPEMSTPRGKGGFGAFGGGHSGKQKKTEFPHRHHDENDEFSNHGAPGPGAQAQKNTGARGGLRSPLLGGGAGEGDYAGGYDDDDNHGHSQNRSPRPSKGGKLRSPILGGGADDDYVDDVFDDEVEEINDPTVLRSPLLAVRTPKSQTGSHTGAQTGAQSGASHAPMPAPNPSPMPGPNPNRMPGGEAKPAPFVQGPYTQASGGQAPNFALQAPPLPAPQPHASELGGGGYPLGGATPAMTNVPAAPTQAPTYSPPPAPPAPAAQNPTTNLQSNPAQISPNAAPGMPASQSFSPGPAGQSNSSSQSDPYSYGVNPANLSHPVSPGGSPVPPSSGYQPPLPRPPLPQPQGQPAVKSSADIGTTKSSPTGSDEDLPFNDDAPKSKGMRGSKLLGDVSDDSVGPLDRRSRFADRRSSGRGTNHGMAPADDDIPAAKNFGAPQVPSAPNPMAPILMVLAVVALLAKGYYMSSYIGNPALLTTALPATVDQLTSMLVLVGIILFAMKASQKG